MSAGIKISGDKLLLLGAAAVLILSCVWIRGQQADIHRLRHGPLLNQRSDDAYRPGKWPRPEATSRVWPSPPTPASGADWHYEVFTPPRIFSNADATVFSVAAPPPALADPDSLEGELLAVKAEPYRLQLMGYVGGSGDYRAVFVRPGQPGTLLIREGQDLPDLGLTLLSLEVKNFSGLPAGPGPARAIMHDARRGENVVLDCRSIRHTGVLLAVLRSVGEERTRECREGDAWTSGGVTYLIDGIQLDPPVVVLTRPGRDGSRPERKALHPVSGEKTPGKLFANAPGARAAGLASEHD